MRISCLLLVCLLLLAGCGSLGIGKDEFSCPGGSTDAARCMSTREVYAATDRSDHVPPPAPVQQKGEEKKPESVPPANQVPASRDALPVLAANLPIPVRSQAKIMRILIFPWEDNDGDLHGGEYVFTEIVGRRWNLGVTKGGASGLFSPLD
ncbi:MAG: type IV conjugative transfer system lipoprotein TraV [Magnetococcales bacterium]|nr:type IV conjugative transfer system lipoprotein TraV [Magnetococcales bacterium]NGZ25386.1 type IV conjugative transfer system lipoprotein TraV [Magnetococcales bacterium]